MNRSLLAAVVLVAGTGLAPAADAHPHYHYYGGCFLLMANDPTPTDTLGGRSRWRGLAGAAVVSTREEGVRPAPTAPIAVSCELVVNGVRGRFILGSHMNGRGVAATPNPHVFTGVTPEDTVALCTHVTVVDEVHPPLCRDATFAAVVPAPVADAVAAVKAGVDPTVCAATSQLAPGVPGVVHVGPDGDVTVPEVGPAPLVECPPYRAPASGTTATRYLTARAFNTPPVPGPAEVSER